MGGQQAVVAYGQELVSRSQRFPFHLCGTRHQGIQGAKGPRRGIASSKGPLRLGLGRMLYAGEGDWVLKSALWTWHAGGRRREKHRKSGTKVKTIEIMERRREAIFNIQDLILPPYNIYQALIVHLRMNQTRLVRRSIGALVSIGSCAWWVPFFSPMNIATINNMSTLIESTA